VSDALMRFIRLGNLTGFPAVAVPCGHDGSGLPVSLQLVGRPWEEGLLLRLASEVERQAPRRVPQSYFGLLDEARAGARSRV
jgi:Asp-tRNA(Asn)/Glu-tRNA(Gln) amidotransferase A subunit family amidase